MADICLGIDLGTTNTCAAFFKNGRPEILENEDGDRLTPTFIFHADKDVVVGKCAQRMALKRADLSIYEIKRLIGRKFDDPEVQRSLEYFPFRVASDKNNQPIIELRHKLNSDEKVLRRTPIQLSADILRKIKKRAEEKFSQEVTSAVITVPAYFNIAQREATMEAAQEAGFSVLKLLNEPTAAALVHLFEKPESCGIFMVFDLGGGTFDVAILRKSQMDIDIICVNGDTSLGGHDIDARIMEFACDILKLEYSYDPKQEPRQLSRLKKLCEDAKQILSHTEETTIFLDGLVPGYDSVDIKLTRTDLERLCDDLFQKMISIVDHCVRSANVQNISEIILAGGSTRIPKIRAMLAQYFGDSVKMNKFVNPDECVAQGAAIQCAFLQGLGDMREKFRFIRDVTPLSLGIGDFVNKMNVAIPRNTPIPKKCTVVTKNVYHNQTRMTFDIFEGERVNCKHNRFLGKLVLDNITAAPPDTVEVILDLEIDVNGILSCKAQERYKDDFKTLKIDYGRVPRSESQVKNTLSDAQEFEQEDQEFLEFAELAGYTKKYCIAVIYNLEKLKLTSDFTDLYKYCKDVETRVASTDSFTAVNKYLQDIQIKTQPLMEQYEFQNMPNKKK